MTDASLKDVVKRIVKKMIPKETAAAVARDGFEAALLARVKSARKSVR